MSARWHETRRESREDAGPGALAGCALLAFTGLYMGLHTALWVMSAVIA